MHLCLLEYFSKKNSSKIKELQCSTFSITFDSWTDVSNQHSYVAVTRHFIPDDSWEVVAIVLDVIPFAGPHTGVKLAEQIALRLQSCSSAVLYCGVTDNA